MAEEAPLFPNSWAEQLNFMTPGERREALDDMLADLTADAWLDLLDRIDHERIARDDDGDRTYE